MKKIPFFIAAMALSTQLMAQRSSVLSAWEYLNTYTSTREENEELAIQALLDAKKEIEPTINNEVTRVESKTWKRRGDVYYLIATDPSPRLVLDKKGAIDTATSSYLKALVVEKKENGKQVIEDRDDIIRKLVEIGNRLMESGNKLMEKENYVAAMVEYAKAKKIYEETALAEPKNTSLPKAAYSAHISMAACAVSAQDYDKVISIGEEIIATPQGGDAWLYQGLSGAYLKKGNRAKALEILGKGKTKFPEESNIYLAEIQLALQDKDAEKAGKLIADAKAKFPDKKQDFVLEEVNFYLTEGNDEKASKALEEAIATFQNDKDILKLLYFNAGIIYDNLAKKNENNKPVMEAHIKTAYDYYMKTLEVDPNYVSAFNQIANYHVTRGNLLVNEANNLPFEKTKEYNAKTQEANNEFLKAAEYLEKGYAIQKDDVIKNNLIEIYKKTKQYDKAKALESAK